ncbi:MAG TPA: branched-chain amino acid ABC transporter permease [Candidatus Dormibacteraeota bacterium]|nr:branched-chain amino acid ABC transporter permease [Candidatus Dormibacteraeota bacterium]
MSLPAWLTLRRATTVAVIALLLVFPFLVDEFWLNTAAFIVIYAIGALGLNVLTGLTGQVSLGHAFFLGVGAYTAAVLGGQYHVMALWWILAAGIVAAICGAIIGPTALRLRGLYLAVVTIGIVFIGQHLFDNLKWLSGGPPGRAIPAPQFGLAFTCPSSGCALDFDQQQTFLGLTFDKNGLFYYLGLVILVLGMLFVRNLLRTRPGRALQAVRERELAASLMGVDLARWKVSAFVISSFLAGISGALLASLVSFIQPDFWSLVLSIQFVAAVIVGGVGTIWGPLLGSVVIFGLEPVMQRYAQSLPLLAHGGSGGGVAVSDATHIFYGIAIVVFLVVEPLGVIGLARRAGRLLHRRRAAATAAAA